MTSMIVVGVDPGGTGGVAVARCIDISEIELLSAMPTPQLTSKGGKPIVDIRKVVDFLAPYCDGKAAVCVIENVHSMPTQGVASSFQFGRQMGGIEAACYEVCERVEYVEPGTWKKHKLIGLARNKDDSRSLASRLWGRSLGDKYWPLKKHDGVAEAALIAWWYINCRKE